MVVGHSKPPKRPLLPPSIQSLPPETTLFRIHDKNYPVTSFNPTLSHRYFGGGRFDATEDDPYPYMYLGTTLSVALSETLLRDLPDGPNPVRILPRSSYHDRKLSAVKVRDNLDVLSLRSNADLGAIRQDTWLTQAPGVEYAQTRHWCHWIRATFPYVAGVSWVSRRDPVGDAIILFGDRVGNSSLDISDHPDLPPSPSSDFSTRDGRAWLKQLVNPHGVTVTV